MDKIWNSHYNNNLIFSTGKKSTNNENSKSVILGQDCMDKDMLNQRNIKYALANMRKKELSHCGVGGLSDECKPLDTFSVIVCLNALYRTNCDALTYRGGRCSLHNSALSDFNIVECREEDFIWRKKHNLRSEHHKS